MKSVRIRSYSGPSFPAIGLNAERYGISLRILSKCGKIRTRTTPNTDTFYTVISREIFVKNYREQLKIFSNLDIKKVINNRSFWKTVSPLFYTKCSKGDKIILNENDKCVSNDDELCQFFLWLLLQYYF